MRTKTVQRYFCDHCSKGMFKKPSMVSHETVCIANPNRACFLCQSGVGGRDYKALVVEFKRRPDVEYNDEHDVHEVKSNDAISWLSSKVDGCPACVLAVLKQGKIMAFGVFEYKDQVRFWNREQNPIPGISI
jgi:hypothetical protein